MTAIGVRHIDFMVLDVEGSEVPVLETIDWSTLSIDVLSIEYSSGDRLGKLAKIGRLLNETGVTYKEMVTLPFGRRRDKAQDVIFMRV